MKLPFQLLNTFLLAIALSACGGSGSGSESASAIELPQQISFESGEQITVSYDTSVDLSVVDGVGNGTLSFQVGDESIISLDAETRIAKAVGVGTTKVTVSKAADSQYLATTAVITVTVEKAVLPQIVFFAGDSLVISYDGQVDTSLVEILGSGNIALQSSDSSIITVDSSTGAATIVAVGTAVITATKASDENYLETSGTLNITVEKAAPPQMAFAAGDSTVISYGGQIDTSLVEIAGSGNIAFQSSDSSIITVDSSTGAATIVAVGTAVITATKAGDENYLETSGTLNITVEKLQAGDISNLAGFTYFPKYNHITENGLLTVSGSAQNSEPDTQVTSITVNGATVQTTDSFATWSLPITLAVGDNLISVQVETATQSFDEIQITSRYQGVVQQASRKLTFDGADNLFFEDYKRNEIINHQLSSGFQSIVTDDVESGLPDDRQSVLLVANANYLYLQVEVSGNNLDSEIYKIDRSTYTASLLSSKTLPNADVDIHDPRDMMLSSDGSMLILAAGNSARLISIDTNTGVKTLIADNDSFNTDDEIGSIEDMLFDEAKNRIVFTGSDPSYDWGLFSIELIGVEANKIKQLAISAAPGCYVMPPGTDSSGLQLNVDDSFYYLAMDDDSLYKVDPSIGCITLVKTLDAETSFGTSSSVQGLALNSQTQDFYLGYFATTGRYNLNTDETIKLEVGGFSDDSLSFSKADFFAFDEENQRIFFADMENFAVFDLQTGAITQKLALPARAEYFHFDKVSKRLYMVLDEFSHIGYIDTTLESFTYVDFSDSSNNGGFDFEDPRGLAYTGSDFVYLLHEFDIYKVSITTGQATMLYVDLADGVDFRRSDHIVYDSKNDRILVADEFNNLLRISAVDAQTGARSVIYTSDGDVNFELFRADSLEVDADSQLLYIVSKNAIYQLDLTNATLSNYIEQSYLDSDLGDLNDIHFSTDGTIYMVDDDINGFWYINPVTNERVILN